MLEATLASGKFDMWVVNGTDVKEQVRLFLNEKADLIKLKPSAASLEVLQEGMPGGHLTTSDFDLHDMESFFASIGGAWFFLREQYAIAYLFWTNSAFARTVHVDAMLAGLVAGTITNVPSWSAATCPVFALRRAEGCDARTRAMIARRRLPAAYAIVSPGQAGGYASNQPGAVVDGAAAAEVDARHPDVARPLDPRGRPLRHDPAQRGAWGAAASNQPGAVLDGAAAAEVDARHPDVARPLDPRGRPLRHDPAQRAAWGAAASNQPGAVVGLAAARARDDAARAAGREPPARVVVGGLVQRHIVRSEGEVAQTRRSLSLTALSLSHQPPSCRAPLSLSSFSLSPLSLLLLSRRTKP